MPIRKCRVCQREIDAITNKRYHTQCRITYRTVYDRLYYTHYNRYGKPTDEQLAFIKQEACKQAAAQLRGY